MNKNFTPLPAYTEGRFIVVGTVGPPPVLTIEVDQGLQWYVFRVFHDCENKTKELLEKKGLEVIVPLMPVRKRVNRHCRRKFMSYEIIFKGYVFVGFEPGDVQLQTVIKAPWVKGVVAPGGKPTCLDAADFARWAKDRDFTPDSILRLVSDHTESTSLEDCIA